MANFRDVIIEALRRDAAKQFFGVNKGIMEVSQSTKRKPGFIKVAISDEAAVEFMTGKQAGFIICFDGDELNRIAAEMDENRKDQSA